MSGVEARHIVDDPFRSDRGKNAEAKGVGNLGAADSHTLKWRELLVTRAS
jgi:hypothetical protein